MLKSIVIKNYALIDNIQVNFTNGLSIITGETGAGKSILLGGLSLVLGKRADLSQIKNNQKKCVIEATFYIKNYNLKPLFEKEDLDFENETIIRREILPSGKSRAFVNDSPVNLNVLNLLSNSLVDVHSQHETLEITDYTFQFQVVDALANNYNKLKEYSAQLSDLKKSKQKLEQLNFKKGEALKEQDYNSFLLNELKEANLIEGELDTLENEFETLNNVEDIQQELSFSNQLLTEENVGILQSMHQLRTSLDKISKLSSHFNELSERVKSVSIEVDDIQSELFDAQGQLEANPQRLEEVNVKLQVIHNLLLKHSSNSIKDLLDIKFNLEQKLQQVINIDDEIKATELSIDKLTASLNLIAREIHNQRREALPILKDKLEAILKELGMANAQFKLKIEKTDSFFDNGKDSLEFLFTANKGNKFGELKKVASGGELSRIMLAIKSVLSNYKQLPTIMFDEIDSGISGEISNKMAHIMKQMSKHMQVFAITHSPQIAAKGDVHFKVFKVDNNNQTTSQVLKLNHDERIIEIAQMLGGKQTSSSAIAHAKQLMN